MKLDCSSEYGGRQAMQTALFPDLFEQKRLGLVLRRPATRDLAAIAAYVHASDFSGRFHFYVTGSILDEDQNAKDIDIVLCPAAGARVSISDVEAVLLALRRFGLASLRIKIDACFRRIGEDEVQQRAGQGVSFASWKLESPQLRWALQKGAAPGEMRRVGRFLVVIRRPLARTNYYRKLPLTRSQNQSARMLRPAVPLRAYRRD